MVKKPSKPASEIPMDAASKAASQPESATPLDTKHQQRLLNIFSDAFNPVLSSEEFPDLLQEIKQALYNRDFATAFGREAYLEAYAARWSPTRTLCYATVFLGIRQFLEELKSSGHEKIAGNPDETQSEGWQNLASTTKVDASSSATSQDSSNHKILKVLSIGGCVAEQLALASYLHDTSSQAALTLLDSAPWSAITSRLQTHITTPPQLSKYASASAKAANEALLEPSQLSVRFVRRDVLELEGPELADLAGREPLVVTLMFTLNELYTNGGVGKTTRFLKRLEAILPSGSLLLVVDSPGSYSEAEIGREKKRYPMQWLLDHTLFEKGAPSMKWERLERQDSVWFRLPEDLSYPIQLENMRYQMHLYRREEVLE